MYRWMCFVIDRVRLIDFAHFAVETSRGETHSRRIRVRPYRFCPYLGMVMWIDAYLTEIMAHSNIGDGGRTSLLIHCIWLRCPLHGLTTARALEVKDRIDVTQTQPGGHHSPGRASLLNSLGFLCEGKHGSLQSLALCPTFEFIGDRRPFVRI